MSPRLPFIALGAVLSLPAVAVTAAPAASGADDAESRCAAIASAAELSAFSGHRYQYATDPMGEQALLLCYYTTQTGPGSRVIRFEIRADADGSQYKFGRQMVEGTENVSGLGERAYAAVSRPRGLGGSTYASHGLTAWRHGRLYSASSDEYGSAQATRNQLHKIVNRLLTAK